MKCTDKTVFASRGEAYDHLANYRKREHEGRLYIYECRYCRQFHLTHIRPERFKRRWAEANKYDFKSMTEQ